MPRAKAVGPRAKAGAEQGRDAKGRWRSGVSGNPAGTPRGSRHRATLAAEALLDGEAEGLTRKAIDLAKAGDTVALRLCLERLVPPRRDRSVSFDMPALRRPQNTSTATAALLAAVTSGELTPREGEAVGKLLELHRRAIELGDHEERLACLEEQLKGR